MIAQFERGGNLLGSSPRSPGSSRPSTSRSARNRQSSSDETIPTLIDADPDPDPERIKPFYSSQSFQDTAPPVKSRLKELLVAKTMDPSSECEQHSHGTSEDWRAISVEDPLVERWPTLLDEIIAVLQAFPIPWRSLNVFRCSIADKHRPDRSEALVVIVLQHQDEQVWSNIRRTVHAVCNTNNQAPIHVELVDETKGYPRAPPPIRSFAIESNHPLIAHWPALRADLLATLDQSGIAWTALNVLRRRRTLEPSDADDTTIVVTTHILDAQQGQMAQERLKGICAQHHQPQLHVELLPGVVRRLGLVEPVDEPYQRPPVMGSSLGPRGVDWASGTMGPVLMLSCAQEPPLACILTCHHVLRPSDVGANCASSDASSGAIGDAGSKNACHPACNKRACYHGSICVPQPDQVVDQPSQKRHDAVLTYYDREIQSRKMAIIESEQDMALGRGGRNMERGLKRQKQGLATYQELATHRESFERRLGSILATSGYRVSATNRCLDWGLVHVEGYSCAGSNRIPQLPRLPGRYSPIQSGDWIDEVSPMCLEEHVLLLGSALGIFPGVFSAIKSTDVWPELQGARTTENVITALDGLLAHPGDSGSPVLDRMGRLVGMLFGGPQSAGAPGYVTPMEEILADIHDQTGFVAQLHAPGMDQRVSRQGL